MNRRFLTIVERALLAVGIVLGSWCAAVLLQARYTAALPPPPAPSASAAATLPGDASPAPTSPPHASVDRGSWIARLEAPSVHLSATVLEGSDDDTLARAAGHIEDTALPGQPGNLAIAGHRDTIFRPVRKLRVGDPLIVRTRDRVYRYRVTRLFVVKPEDVYVLDPTRQPTLTLVTCYPFEFIGHAPKRFIVRAEMVNGGKEGSGE
jgi:sortase A